jgi:tetratricopeptide (TPR) repeat protein
MFYEANVNQINSIEAYYYLGIVCARQGKLETAISHYKYALFCEPGHYQSLTNLGSLLIIRGRFNEGMHYFHTALEAFIRHRATHMLPSQVENDGSPVRDAEPQVDEIYHVGIFEFFRKCFFGSSWFQSDDIDPNVLTEAFIRSYHEHVKMDKVALSIWIVDFVILCLYGEPFTFTGISSHTEPIAMTPDARNLRWFLQ